ncbi:MAG TPA: hypothetical protein VFQ36_12325, partial [Ktedonobacteraceae bacterium]|nr:hypothetical protein [Ktedonobacteraceae bacterium]
MINVHLQNLLEVCASLLKLLKAEMTQAHHIVTMRPVSLIQVVLENEEIGQGNCKIVDFHVVKQMPLS